MIDAIKTVLHCTDLFLDVLDSDQYLLRSGTDYANNARVGGAVRPVVQVAGSAQRGELSCLIGFEEPQTDSLLEGDYACWSAILCERLR